MPADEQDLFEQEALEEAVATREVHPESPELVTAESLAAEEAEGSAEVAAEEATEEPAATEPPAAEEPAVETPATTPPPPPAQHMPPGFIPERVLHQRLGAEQSKTQEVAARVEELAAGLEAIQQHFETERAARAAADEASAIPAWDKDPIGHLRQTVTREVLAGLKPTLEPLQEMQVTLGKLDGLVGQTEEQMKERELDVKLRQAYSMQDQAAMADPEAAAAINYFHRTKFQEFLDQGYDQGGAGHMANEARFQLYKTTGAQNGPAALLAAYRNLGVSPSAMLQSQRETAPPAEAAPSQVPQTQTQVPPQAPVTPTAPPGPRRIDEMPPPTRSRRQSEAESTAYNYIMHHYEEIPENQLDAHIQKFAEEEKIPLTQAYDRVLQGLRSRARSA